MRSLWFNSRLPRLRSINLTRITEIKNLIENALCEGGIEVIAVGIRYCDKSLRHKVSQIGLKSEVMLKPVKEVLYRGRVIYLVKGFLCGFFEICRPEGRGEKREGI